MGAGAIVGMFDYILPDRLYQSNRSGVVAGGWGYHESELSNPLEQNITSFKVC